MLGYSLAVERVTGQIAFGDITGDIFTRPIQHGVNADGAAGFAFQRAQTAALFGLIPADAADPAFVAFHGAPHGLDFIDIAA